MLKLYDNGIYLVNGETICSCPEEVAQKTGRTVDAKEAEKGTMAYGILQAHNKSGDPDQLQLKFDSMTSHDITYVGIIQTARASGMKKFPTATTASALSAAPSTRTTTSSPCLPLINTAASTSLPTWPTSTATTVRPWPAAAR